MREHFEIKYNFIGKTSQLAVTTTVPIIAFCRTLRHVVT